MSSVTQAPGAPDQPANEAEREILRTLRGLRYGALEIQVHDARIVQIERRERLRFEAPKTLGR